MLEEKDFTSEEVVEFEIEGNVFQYKPVSGGDDLDWMDEYMEVENGKPKVSFSKMTQCKLRNLVSVPISKELISKKIKVNKEWKYLSLNERTTLLKKLDKTLLDKIIKKINELDKGSEVKKN